MTMLEVHVGRGGALADESALSFPRTRESKGRCYERHSPDTRFRGYDNVRENYNSAFLGSPTMNSRVPGSTEFNRS